MITSKYENVLAFNVPERARATIVRALAPAQVSFPSIRLPADVLLARVQQNPRTCVVLWGRFEDLRNDLADILAGSCDLFRIGFSPIQVEQFGATKSLGFAIYPYARHQGASLSTLLDHTVPNSVIREYTANRANKQLGDSLLLQYREQRATFRNTGCRDLLETSAQDLTDPERPTLVFVGSAEQKSVRRNLDVSISALKKLREEFGGHKIVYVSNIHLTMSALAERHTDFAEVCDTIVWEPWAADRAQGAEIIASYDPGICLDAYLRGFQVLSMSSNLYGLYPKNDDENRAAILFALSQSLLNVAPLTGEVLTLGQALETLSKRNCAADAPVNYHLPAIARNYHLVEAANRTLDYDKACKLLLTASKTFPDDDDIQRRLGDMYLKKNEYSLALKAANAALRLRPDSSEALALRGRANIKLGNMRPEVGEDIWQAVKLRGSNAQGLAGTYFNFEWERAPITDELLQRYSTIADRYIKDYPIGRKGAPRDFLMRLAAMYLETGQIRRARIYYDAGVMRNELPDAFAKLHRLFEGRRKSSRPGAHVKRAFPHVMSNRHMFFDLLHKADGNVAIVGNGPQEVGKKRGPEIDSHNCVIRFNTFRNVYPYSADYGVKTDLWVRMPPSGYVKTPPEAGPQHIMVTGSNRLNRPTTIWRWIDDLIEQEKSVGFFPKEPFYELIQELGTIPTAGLVVAYMYYREAGPIDPKNVFGCSFATDEPAPTYHYSDGLAAAGARHSFDAEREFFKKISNVDEKDYYLPLNVSARAVQLSEEAKVASELAAQREAAQRELEKKTWRVDQMTGQFDRVLSASPGLVGYNLFGRDVEVIPRKEIHAALADTAANVLGNSTKFPTLASRSEDENCVILGFGLGPTGQLGSKLSEHLETSYMTVEYGLISSFHLPSEKQYNFSLFLDDRGVFYDTTRESRLEQLLEEGFGADTSELVIRARSFIDTVVENGITKYNNTDDLTLPPRMPGKRRILVIDQTKGDLSIEYGQCDLYSFQDMLNHALSQTDAEVFLKPHPETLAGAKGANYNIDELRRTPGLNVIEEKCNIMSLFPQVDEVYVMVSGVGFEALMADKKVTCFGAPFYAGRGLTVDMITPMRPRRKLTVEELVAAVFLCGHQFYDPVTKQPATPEECLERVCQMKEERNLAQFDAADHDEVDVPDYLAKALEINPSERALWSAETPDRKRGLAYRVASAKTDPTRQKRVNEVFGILRGELDMKGKPIH